MSNISTFAETISMLVGQTISDVNIHPMNKGRYYYIQAPKVGHPMLLHHYRGPFFIDIHPDDYEEIAEGKISALDYIRSANWQVGYFWGGGGMIGGGYYQPFDIVGRPEEVRRYLQILSCRGFNKSCGYMPKEDVCRKCFVDNCPFSKYKEGNWENELAEYDPRVDLFEALCKRFEQENPGYILRNFTCGDSIPKDEVWITPFGRYNENEPFSFSTCVSSSVIQSLLMRKTEPESFEDYAKGFRFRIYKMFEPEIFDVNSDTLKKAYEGMDFTKKKSDSQPAEDTPAIPKKERVSLMSRLISFFKK